MQMRRDIMRTLHALIARIGMKTEGKNRLYILSAAVICAALGFAVWEIAGSFVPGGTDRMLIFILLPGVMSMFSSILFLYNNRFS